MVDPDINWQSETIRPTWSKEHNVSVNGDVEATRYNFSFNRYKEDGIFNNSGFGRTTANMRINQKLTNSITLDARVNYAMVNRARSEERRVGKECRSRWARNE